MVTTGSTKQGCPTAVGEVRVDTQAGPPPLATTPPTSQNAALHHRPARRAHSRESRRSVSASETRQASPAAPRADSSDILACTARGVFLRHPCFTPSSRCLVILPPSSWRYTTWQQTRMGPPPPPKNTTEKKPGCVRSRRARRFTVGRPHQLDHCARHHPLHSPSAPPHLQPPPPLPPPRFHPCVSTPPP